MDEKKTAEILAHAEELLAEESDKSQVAKDIMNSYIFNTPYEYGEDEHYKIDDILALVNQKYAELFSAEPEEEIAPEE